MTTESKKIIHFLILTFISSYALEFYVILNGGIEKFGMLFLTALMWLPGLSSLIIRLLSKDWSDIGLKISTPRAYLAVSLLPFILSFLTFYLCTLLDIRRMGLVDGVPASKILIQYLIIFFIGLFSAFGEELGWRGFLTPKIYKSDWRWPTLKSGVIWSLWHIPLVAFAGYYKDISPLIVILLYSFLILTLNIFMNWVRLYFESVIVATFAHAFYNFFFQTFWLHLLFKTPGKNIEYWNILGADMGVFPTFLFAVIICVGYLKCGYKMKIKKTM